jgi:hypothetical protein
MNIRTDEKIDGFTIDANAEAPAANDFMGRSLSAIISVFVMIQHHVDPSSVTGFNDDVMDELKNLFTSDKVISESGGVTLASYPPRVLVSVLISMMRSKVLRFTYPKDKMAALIVDLQNQIINIAKEVSEDAAASPTAN